MKVKIAKITAKISETENFDCEGIELELTEKDIAEFSKLKLEEMKQAIEHNIPIYREDYLSRGKKAKNKFVYSDGIIEIEIGDIARILPAENCISNGDTIKYDERIDGLSVEVIGIDYKNMEIKVRSIKMVGHGLGPFKVHPHWLKYESIDKVKK